MKSKRGFKKAKGFQNKILAEQGYLGILGKNVFYKNTNTYKAMSKIEKIGLEDYLRNKRVTLKFILTVICLSFLFLIVKPELTGKIVGDIDYTISSLVLYLSLIFVGLIVFFLFFKKRDVNKK